MAMGGPMGGPPPMMGGRPPMPPGGKGPGGPFGKMPPGGKMPMEKADDFYEENFDMAQMEKECEEMLNVTYLTKDNCNFSTDNGDFINLSLNGITYKNVSIIRTFPFTEPDMLLSVRESTGKKKEIGIISDLNADFDEGTVKIISKQLSLRYYMPIIQKIISIKESAGYVHFKVDTNHGELQFSLQSNGSHFSYLSETRILITDLEGNRYEIPDTSKLTAKELKKLDLYM